MSLRLARYLNPSSSCTWPPFDL
uniref:Uncharacterized protein n=1 Tax=Rhizophora mucronata TaxID=61149 RepID=A0A2P2NN56_RHIMU